MKIKILIFFLAVTRLVAEAQFVNTTNNGVIYTTNGDGSTFSATGYTSSPTDVIILDNINSYPVTSIGGGAFQYCNSLTNVVIGTNIASIGDWAFDRSGLTSITIPNSLTEIGNYVFSVCASLTSVTIPNSVTNIGEDAFATCSLTNVVIPDSVTSIGEGAFYHDTSLTNVVIGKSVMSIGIEAFGNCYDLTSIIFLGNAPELGADVFYDITTTNKLSPAVVYYYYGTNGWASTYGGLPTVELFAPPHIGNGSVSVQSGNFTLPIIGVTNQTVVIEASTDLLNWQPVWTNTLTSMSTNFTDLQWTNYSARFYRVGAQ